MNEPHAADDASKKPDPAIDEQPSSRPDEPAAVKPVEDSGHETELTGSDEPVDEAAEPEDDGLPEWEPLTPELVEDEAIRGDFMLRWAVVLLALLLGCSEISQSATLVHIKAGQAIAENGFWPPAQDLLSYTATDRRWINLSWLFDLALAGIYGIGGAAALVIFKAVLAATVFYLVVHLSKEGVSTWWGSICAALALLVCYRQFTALPELVTLLGVALVLRQIHRWETSGSPKSLWILPAVFAVWANLDPRMFVGVFLFLLYCVGRSIRSPAESTARGGKLLWGVAAACAGAALLNPFGWHSLSAPYALYVLEDEAWRLQLGPRPGPDGLGHFPIVSGVYWQAFGARTLAVLLSLAAGFVALALNRKQFDVAHLLMLAGLTGLAAVSSHELASAALVATFVATLNGQAWYRANVRQEYSVETSELVFSRGGRAVTVLAFFAVAALAIGGRLSGPNSNRIGLGFDPLLTTTVESMRTELASAYDDRPFHFTTRQGDQLVWIGKRSFLDSRLGLFCGTGEQDLVALHDATRRALRRERPAQVGSGRRDVWNATFRRFDVTHVIPRLAGFVPDYVTYVDLLSQGDDWQLTKLGSAVAVFYRNNPADPELTTLSGYRDYLDAHHVNVLDAAFRTEVPQPLPRSEWAKPKSFYETYLILPRAERPADLQLALHYHKHLELAADGGIGLSPALQAAYCLLTIRHANIALGQDSQNVEAYRLLGSAYANLGNLETAIARTADPGFLNAVRYYQTLHAYNQAITIDPSDAATHLRLHETYLLSGRSDLALRELEAYDRLTRDTENLTEQQLRFEQDLLTRLQELNRLVDAVNLQLPQQPADDQQRLAAAFAAYQAGCPLKALALLDDDLNFVGGNPLAQLLRGRLLMEVGRPEEASETFQRLELVANRSGVPNWQEPFALASLGNADYVRAVGLWSQQATQLRGQVDGLLVGGLPMTEGTRGWPLRRIQFAATALFRDLDSLAALQLFAGLCQVEAGQRDSAQAHFQELLDLNPETRLRPLVAFYLTQLTGDMVDLLPPSERIPIEPDMFGPEPDEENGTAESAQ